VPEAEFEGQTKSRLGSPGVRSVVDKIVGDALEEVFEWNPKILGSIIDKSLAAMAAANAAKAARDFVRRKSLLTSTVLPGKVAMWLCVCLCTYICIMMFVSTHTLTNPHSHVYKNK
jgi:DNA gyrase subunit B